jgi:hypothetical protein
MAAASDERAMAVLADIRRKRAAPVDPAAAQGRNRSKQRAASAGLQDTGQAAPAHKGRQRCN